VDHKHFGFLFPSIHSVPAILPPFQPFAKRNDDSKKGRVEERGDVMMLLGAQPGGREKQKCVFETSWSSQKAATNHYYARVFV